MKALGAKADAPERTRELQAKTVEIFMLLHKNTCVVLA